MAEGGRKQEGFCQPILAEFKDTRYFLAVLGGRNCFGRDNSGMFSPSSIFFFSYADLMPAVNKEHNPETRSLLGAGES
jgi:hypothetical protein